MNRDTQESRGAGKPQLVVRGEWRTGPRTPMWDELWARILDDLHRRGSKYPIGPISEDDRDG